MKKEEKVQNKNSNKFIVCLCVYACNTARFKFLFLFFPFWFLIRQSVQWILSATNALEHYATDWLFIYFIFCSTSFRDACRCRCRFLHFVFTFCFLRSERAYKMGKKEGKEAKLITIWCKLFWSWEKRHSKNRRMHS